MTKTEKAPQGRPTAGAKKKKSRPFRADDAEWASYQRKAKSLGLSTAEWIRQTLSAGVQS